MPKLHLQEVAQAMTSVYQVLNSVMCHLEPETWIQPDGEVQEYLLQNDL